MPVILSARLLEKWMITEITLFWLILAQIDFRGGRGTTHYICLTFFVPVLCVRRWKCGSDNHFDRQAGGTVTLAVPYLSRLMCSQIEITTFSSLVKVYIAAEHISIHISKQCPVLWLRSCSCGGLWTRILILAVFNSVNNNEAKSCNATSKRIQKEVILAQLLHDWLRYPSKNIWGSLETSIWDVHVELSDMTQDVQD